MRKDKKWVWEKSQQKAFDDLKQIFTTKPVLAVPDLDKEFRVEAGLGLDRKSRQSEQEARLGSWSRER